VRTLEEFLRDELASGALPDFSFVPRKQGNGLFVSVTRREGAGETVEFRVVDNILIPTACRSAPRAFKVPRGTFGQ